MSSNKSIKTEVAMLLLNKGWTQEKLVKEMGARLNKNYSSSNLGNKLRLETIPYREIKLIADILGYDIEFVDRDKK
ncbi:MAG: hypothetical protein OSJ27_04920 [Candidatus Gastranaerophilales bacterium]|nr:hypothetical protein [Candidatus Gastranaerophilales bacterium]